MFKLNHVTEKPIISVLYMWALVYLHIVHLLMALNRFNVSYCHFFPHFKRNVLLITFWRDWNMIKTDANTAICSKPNPKIWQYSALPNYILIPTMFWLIDTTNFNQATILSSCKLRHKTMIFWKKAMVSWSTEKETIKPGWNTEKKQLSLSLHVRFSYMNMWTKNIAIARKLWTSNKTSIQHSSIRKLSPNFKSFVIALLKKNRFT